MERSARFYERAFGLRRFGAKGDGKVIPLVSPGLKDQITLSSDEASELGGVHGQAGEHGGIDHFGFLVPPGTRLDGVIETLTSLGATFLAKGELVHDDGVSTTVSGLYYAGLACLKDKSSGFLGFLERDSEHVATHIPSRLASLPPPASHLASAARPWTAVTHEHRPRERTTGY